MNNASGVDLNWFWRGWFFTTEHVDLAIANVVAYEPVFTVEQAEKIARQQKENTPEHVAKTRDSEIVNSAIELDKTLKDKYNEPQTLLSENEIKQIEATRAKLTDEDLALLESGQKYYEITFNALGGMIMPLIVQFEFEDGSKEVQRIPAEIWKLNQKEVTKIFKFKKEIKSVTLGHSMKLPILTQRTIIGREKRNISILK